MTPTDPTDPTLAHGPPNPTDPTLTHGAADPVDSSEAAWDVGLAAAFDANATRAHTPDLEPGTILAGKYKLTERIGEGGMGSVWVAQQSEPVKRKVAVKLIKLGMDSKTVLARFEAERQALALMDHPNIAKVLDGGLHEGRPFFVMELVKGVPITEYCDARRLTPKERLELFVPVCQAIQHAHQKGVIHRDVKPSNVLIALYDDKPVPKVIDFGVAKATGQALTEATIDTGFGGVVGTPQYMSPEQATLNNLDIDTRSDVYSLGVLLYELLTGSPPFARKELQKAGLLEILRVVREEEPPRPSTKLSTADALPSLSANRGTEPKKLTGLLRNELDWIVMKALEKDRTRRYETANGFAADVLRYLAGEPVLAHPPSVAYRFKKFVRRNKGQVLAASLVLLALLAGIVGTSWGYFVAKHQETEANRAAEAERFAKLDAQEQQVKAEASALAEKTANERTQQRLAQIEKGVELFAGLVGGINPRNEEKGGPSLYEQLRERAVKAADELNDESVGDQEAVARLQTLLGDTLRELGAAGKAVEVLERARTTREGRLGQDHPDTLVTLNRLAGAYEAVGKLPEAIALLEQVRDGMVKNLGADHRDTLFTKNDLANAYRFAGKPAEAFVLLEQVTAALMKEPGPEHRHTLATLDNLAGAYQDAGRLPDAIALFERVKRDRIRILGPDHPETLTTLNNLAGAYGHDGRLSEAIALFKQILDVRIKTLGLDHPDTLLLLHNLARAYQAAGKLDQALPPFEQAAAGIEKRRFLHEHAGLVITNTIAAYEQAKQWGKAEAWRRKWLAVVKQKSGAESSAYAGELAALGVNLLEQEKWAEAEPLLRECLTIREKAQPDAWNTFNTQSMLGGALLGQKKYADAEPLLVKGYEGMKAREKTIPPAAGTRIPEALDRLIELATATNKPDDVEKWRAERAKYPEVAPPPRERK